MRAIQNIQNAVSDKKSTERALDTFLGEMYRNDPTATGISFTSYKKNWQQAQKLKQMKIRYTIFEPLPDETAIEFKRRLKSIVLSIPVETMKEFEERIKRTFSQ